MFEFRSLNLYGEQTACFTAGACLESQYLACLKGSMLTGISAGDEWPGCEPVSCGGYGFTRVRSRGGKSVTVQLEQGYHSRRYRCLEPRVFISDGKNVLILDEATKLLAANPKY